jgi:hypothetical protein
MENATMPLTDTSYAADLLLAERSVGLFNALEISASDFQAAYELPIGQHVEKDYKGLSYLSWPFAFLYLKQHFPSLYVAFEETGHGNPVFGEPGAYFLRPYLTDGLRRTAALVFPVMDRRHNSIKELDGRAISDNVQRASVKAIATFTGLGLKLYAGEDIPSADDAQGSSQLPQKQEAKKSATVQPKNDVPSEPSTSATPAFSGKEYLTKFCKANPFGYDTEQESLMSGKEALETMGLSKADELKDASAFGVLITTMVSNWIRQNKLKLVKSEVTSRLDAIKEACVSYSLDQAISEVQSFVAEKK